MAALIIVVNADPRALRHTEALLTEQGYLVAASSSFPEARKLLDSVMPDVLIADLRLGRLDGLHLAIESQRDHPDVPVIVTFSGEDTVPESDRTRSVAAFIRDPLENPHFLPSVQAAVVQRRRAQGPIRRWSRKPVTGVVEVDVADARARIIDMSYGGVRLTFSDAREVPTTFDIVLPPAGVRVRAHCVWTAHSASDHQVLCGAELADAVRDHHWREFVHSQQGG
jgi:DNA-binding response OmpR family regulator